MRIENCTMYFILLNIYFYFTSLRKYMLISIKVAFQETWLYFYATKFSFPSDICPKDLTSKSTNNIYLYETVQVLRKETASEKIFSIFKYKYPLRFNMYIPHVYCIFFFVFVGHYLKRKTAKKKISISWKKNLKFVLILELLFLYW